MRKDSTRLVVSIFYSFLGLTLLMLISCGGGGSGGGASTPPPVPTTHTPSISNLQYSPQTATQNQGGGSVTATGTINFVDQGGDVTTLTLNVYDAQGKLLSTETNPLHNTSGVISGTIAITVLNVSTANVADYTFEVYVTDVAGNSSNRLTGTFRVIGSVNPIYDKTVLLRGNWHFVYTIISTWTDDYSLSTIPTDHTNNQGGYWIYGTNEWGNTVVASYWPNDGYWALGDYNSTIIDLFYVFYTDGATILPNSCYYQIEKSTGNWSRCYSLSGSKTSLIPGLSFEQNTLSTKQEKEKLLLLEKMDFAPVDVKIKGQYLEHLNLIKNTNRDSVSK